LFARWPAAHHLGGYGASRPAAARPSGIRTARRPAIDRDADRARAGWRDLDPTGTLEARLSRDASRDAEITSRAEPLHPR
jgi:hypothetical protein